MSIEQAKLTKQGKTIAGDPEPGKYYRVEVPEGTEPKAAAAEFKKKFPKSFFVFRSHGAERATGKPETKQPDNSATKN